MTYGSGTNVKIIMGQTTGVNDTKITKYQLIAYNWINASLTNIETVIPIPTATLDPYISDFEDNLTAAYFYKYESGDNVLADTLEKQFKEVYMRNKYSRPSFITRPTF